MRIPPGEIPVTIADIVQPDKLMKNSTSFIQRSGVFCWTEMKNFKLLVFLLAALLSVFFYSIHKNSTRRALNNISQEDRGFLEFFFRAAYANDGLGYTLFGDKPVTATIYYDPCTPSCNTPTDIDLFYLCPELLKLGKGHQTLIKYRDLFFSGSIKIVDCKNFIENEFRCVLFINTSSFRKTVANNLRDFKAILGNHTTPESLLEKILNSDDPFGDILKNHQGLIGTLLGYGRDNAWLFHKREECYFSHGTSPLLTRKPFSITRRSRSLSNGELEALESRLQPFDDRGILDFNPLLMRLPSFVADPDNPETKQLLVRYQSQYRDIIRRYRNRDFLEVTIARLSSK